MAKSTIPYKLIKVGATVEPEMTVEQVKEAYKGISYASKLSNGTVGDLTRRTHKERFSTSMIWMS